MEEQIRLADARAAQLQERLHPEKRQQPAAVLRQQRRFPRPNSSVQPNILITSTRFTLISKKKTEKTVYIGYKS